MGIQNLKKVLNNENDNYIFPFLWMKGESQDVINEEIDRIYDCGIRAICIESRPHPDFLGEGWWKDMDFIVAKAKEKGMKIWLLDDAHFPTGYANHLIPDKYPERKKVYINYNAMDVWGAKSGMEMPIDSMMKPKTTWMDIGKPADLEERANNKAISITAYPLVEDAAIDFSNGIDLLPYYADGKVVCQLPEGNWRIFVVYETRTDGGNPDYINIIDEDSVAVLIEAVYESHYQRYPEEFGKTFAGFFSDEPGFGNTVGFLMDERIGKKEMPLPWNKDVPGMLRDRLGDCWAQKLAALWTNTVDDADASKVRLAYMDVVTELYSKNFCGQLGRWCEERGVEYVGHVIEDNGEHARVGCGAGHFFRAMAGQHMAGVDSIGQQIMPGGADVQHLAFTPISGKFNHYVLAKMGASSGHIDPNKHGRTLCEACGAYGWKFGVRDMKWLLDHLLAQGINHFVPHAFSMAEYPDFDCPPHFYARGNNPQYKYFAELMKYTNRMCELLNGGKHGAKVAMIYQAEAEWMGEYMDMAEVAKVLSNNQIDFDIIPIDALENMDKYHGAMINDGRTLMLNGQTYDLLLVPYARYITKPLNDFVKANPEMDICFVDGYPDAVISKYDHDAAESFETNAEWMALENLADYAKERYTSIALENDFKSMIVYDYEKDGKIYMLFNADMYDTYEGDIIIDGEKEFVLYDGLKNICVAVDCKHEDGQTKIHLTLPIYQSCVLVEVSADQIHEVANSDRCPMKVMEAFADLSGDWTVSSCRSIDYPNFVNAEQMTELAPYSDKYPEFSGYIRYERTLELAESLDTARIRFESVYENMELWIDDVNYGKVYCPPYQYIIANGLAAGTHRIRVEVATTLDREQQTMPKPPFQYIFEAVEPTGMFGKVILEK